MTVPLMGATEFYYQTSVTIDGPWLLDKMQLLELDSVLENEFERLGKHREKYISEEVEKELPDAIRYATQRGQPPPDEAAVRNQLYQKTSASYPYNHNKVQVELVMGDRKADVASLKDALEDLALKDSLVTGISISMRVMEVRAVVDFRRNPDWLTLTVSPETFPESRETFAALRGWVQKHRPPAWQAHWGIIGVLCWCSVFAYIAISSALFTAKPKDASPEYKATAVEILKAGVTPQNQAKAIETTLALQLGYNPNPGPAEPPKWWLPSVCAALLACIILSFAPRPNVAIGMGERKVIFWRKWIRVVTISVPRWCFITENNPSFGKRAVPSAYDTLTCIPHAIIGGSRSSSGF